MSTRGKLNVGLLLDSFVLPSWIVRVLEEIARSSYASITVAIKSGFGASPATVWSKMLKLSYGSSLCAAVARLDRALFSPKPDALARQDVRELLAQTPLLVVKPTRKESVEDFEAADLRRIAALRLDVLIKLGFAELGAGVMGCSRYGVWGYCLEEPESGRRGPPSFWDVYERRHETRASLHILGRPGEPSTVLERFSVKTDSVSSSRSLNDLCWKACYVLPRKLQALHGGADLIGLASASKRLQGPLVRSTARRPGADSLSVPAIIAQHYGGYMLRKLRSWFFLEQWILLCGPRFDLKSPAPLRDFRKIVPPPDRSWADPFVIKRGNLYYVFLEEYPFSSRRGYISCMTINKNGEISLPKTILERPYHLSYPFVFAHQDAYYMLPETRQNQTIQLYKCTDFPWKWELASVLMDDVRAVDSTLIWERGKWWLFTALRQHDEAPHADELFLFFSTDLLSGKWLPHPKNPVLSDIKSARPAGRILRHNGNLYRPSQNNAKRYGGAVKINRVDALSEVEYRETCVNEIQVGWDHSLIGIHTLTSAGNISMMDARMVRSRFSRLRVGPLV